jgi:hypothetical protein
LGESGISTRLSAQRHAVSEFETTAQGCRLATSVGGVLTGRGGRHLHHHRRSAEARGCVVAGPAPAANDWFDHTLYSRLNDTRSGAITVIMHRLHEDDLQAT